MSTKTIWVVLRIIGLVVCSFYFVSNNKVMRSTAHEVNQATIEVEQAWTQLEKDSPVLAKKYTDAVKVKVDRLNVFASHDTYATLTAIPLAFLLTSLLWQLVLNPLKSWWRTRKPQQQQS